MTATPDILTKVISTVIGIFSPQKAMTYRAQRIALRNYAAGKMDGANAQWYPTTKTADEDYLPDKQRIINRCRDTAKNDMFVSGAINKICTNVVRNGQKFQANILRRNGKPADTLNEKIESELTPAVKGAALDITGHDSIYALQRLILRSCWIDGQVFIRRVWVPGSHFGFKLKLLKSDRLDDSKSGPMPNGNVSIGGIEFFPDSMEPAGYHFVQTILQNSYSFRYDSVRYDAKDIIHVWNREEVEDQTQGVPWIVAIVMEAFELKEFRRYESIAARTAAAFAIFLKQEFPEAEVPDIWNASSPIPKYVQPGTMQKLPWGVGIDVAKSDRPSTSFAPWMDGSLQGQAAGVGLSYGNYSNNRAKSSYSAERSGTIEERFGFQWQQGFLNEKFNFRLWEWIVEALQIKGYPVSAGEHAFSLEMQSDGWPWIDPKKDVEAAAMEWGMGSNTLKNIMAAHGRDYQETKTQREKEAEDFAFLNEGNNDKKFEPTDDKEPKLQAV